MSNSIKLTASHDACRSAKKAYVARITGRDTKYTFAREFVSEGGRDRVDATATIDEPGLYELKSVSKKEHETISYTLLIECDGELEELTAEKSEAMKIAKLMDEGRQFASIVVSTPHGWEYITAKQAEKAAVAATIDNVTDGCWALIQSLGEREAKAVLNALRKRVTPPKPATTVGLSEEAPVGLVADANQEAGASEEQLGLNPTPVAEEPTTPAE